MPASLPRAARLVAAGALVAAAASAASACIASAPEGIRRQTDDDAGAPPATFIDASVPDGASTIPIDAGSSDPHAVLGVDPPHGPFNGGQRVLVTGKGFGSDVRVWFGDAEVDPATILAIDPTRVQVNAPPGEAGPVDVTVQNGNDESTRRTLPGGYAYDALYAVPNEGPVSGGTIIQIVGQGTKWNAKTVAKIDQKPCTTLEVESETLLTCTVPQGQPGSKSIAVVETADGDDAGDTIVVLDAFTYQDSNNGFKGGLSGAPLDGELKVLVYDNFTGNAIPGAYAIVGTKIETALVEQADGSGVAIVADPSLDGPRTVTVAAKCHSPVSFVDVPVDTVTAYLDPVLSPACASGGDPPPVGGNPQATGVIKGELVWKGGIEFQKAPWVNVPAPADEHEVQSAYLFMAVSEPTAPFQLPAASNAVHPDSPGDFGYAFAMTVPAGNRTIYALAGIENTAATPPTFTAYVMGVMKGLPVLPSSSTENVYVPMDKTLDQAITMVVNAPPPGPKGPDRLQATVAIMLGNDGYAILPAGQKSPLLPVAGDLQLVGFPGLDGSLAGSSYISTARAVTGPLFGAPMSVVGRLLSTTTSQPVTLDGFVGIPTLVTPEVNAKWDGMHLATAFGKGSSAIDLSVYDIASGNGLVRWTIAVPKGDHAIELPDLSGIELGHLPPGPVTIGVYGARIDGFDYANLKYRDMRPQGMTAYAYDVFSAHL